MRTSRSGIKRGLATVAVSALAVTGIPFLIGSASANSLADQAGGASNVILVAPAASSSIENDGVNTTVHLVANGGSAVQKVRFEYKGALQVDFTAITTVSRSNGAFSAEWTPPSGLYNLAGTQVRAVALGANDIELGADANSGIVGTTRSAIDIATAAGAGVGVYEQPYAAPDNKALGVVSGTTSNLAANPDIELSSPSGTGVALQEDLANDVAAGATTRGWSGAVDLSGYAWDNAAPIVDEALVHVATDPAGSDDAEAITVYKQSIATVNAVADPAQVQGASTSTGVVTVLDGQGKPIAGAQVFQDDNNDNAGDGAAVYTNSKGEARFPGLAGSPGGTQHSFFVNVTGNPAYENNTDFKKSVTVTSYTAVPTTLTAASKDGAAFDDDEFATGDITVNVKDQNANPLTGQQVTYFWNVAPFATTAGYPKDLPAATAIDNGDGTYSVGFPGGEPSGTYTLNYYINTDGTPGQGATDPTGADLVVKAGQAVLSWADGATAQAPAGTTATFAGSLELEDGTALAGRDVVLEWDPTADAVVAAQGAQPAGTTRVSNTAAGAVTKADGTFGIAIVDPAASPNVDELNGDLDADTAFTPAAPTLDVDFLKNPDPSTPADITISRADLVDGMATPGRPVDLDVTVDNAEDVPLTDYPVTIEVDHGFLSPNAETAAALVADPAAAQDGLYGEWKSDGTEKEYTTDDSGKTGAVVAIEKDAGFATDDTVTTTVTVTAGTVSKTFAVDFTSKDPLNGGDVSVDLAAAADQTVSVLPKAPTTEIVKYDVFVEDQFGNLVDGEQVNLSDDLTGAAMNGSDGATTVSSQLPNELPSLTLSSTAEGAQKVSADWVVDSNTWTDGDAAAGFQPARDSDNEDTTREVDAAPVDWYDVDYAAGEYTMTDNAADPLPVGSAVTVTYKAVDQNGEPIQGLQVNFFRAGPDDEQDGDGDAAVVTDADGEAAYDFQGIKDGTAIIQTVVREPAPSTVRIEAATVTHFVTFGNPEPPISPLLSGRSRGDKDVLKINAPGNARGARVVLYGRIGGEIVKLKRGTLNSRGNLVLEVRDRNGNKKAIQYAAVVKATSRTQQAVTNIEKLR